MTTQQAVTYHDNLMNASNVDEQATSLTTRLMQAKSAYTTRRINKRTITALLPENRSPRTGDLVLARVEKLGQHQRIELENGRRAPLFIGDEIVVCYGNRYSPDQFEAEVPTNLDGCHLVAAGGIASRSLSRHGKMREPTLLLPLGLLGNAEGRPVNLSDAALPEVTNHSPRPFIIAVAGTSMNAGKTTSAAYLIRGLARSGLKVGAAKVTGTGAGGDLWLMRDAGATEVLDFTDAGFASTFKSSVQEIEGITSKLIAHLQNIPVDTIVLEVADGLLQTETAQLLCSPVFKNYIDGMIFAAGDAMGASSGIQWLQQRDLPVAAISGCVSASPLAARETELNTGLPVWDIDQLASPGIAVEMFERCADWMNPNLGAVK